MTQIVDEMVAVRHDERPWFRDELSVNGIADGEVRMLLEVARKTAQECQKQTPGGQKEEKNCSAFCQGKPPFRQFPDRGMQAVGQGGAKREREERLKPSPQEQNHGQRQI